MTPRSSVRARAREIYREMAQGEAARSELPSAPHPSSLRFDGQAPNPLPHSSPDGERPLAYGERGQTEHATGIASDLTARVRALYENSAVPVREIAATVGVTERTIYKYVAKGGWKKRYRWPASGAPGAAARPPDFAPVTGAGGRFIRREDKGKPFATGLKATDPSGRGKALAACGKAQRLSRAAQAKAAKEARAVALIRAVASNARAFAELRRHRESYVKGRPVLPLQLRIEEMLIDMAQWSVRRLDALVPPAAKPAPVAPAPRYGPDDFRVWQPRPG